MSLTKQDIQSCMDQARMRIMDNVPTRQDVQTLKDTTRNLVTLLNQSQQYMTQSHRERSELIRRAVSLDSRLTQLEQELHEVRKVLTVVSQKPQQRVIQNTVAPASEELDNDQYRGYTPISYAQG